MHQTSQHKIFYSFFIIGFLLLGSRSFAQDPEVINPPTTEKVAPAATPAPAETEVHDTKDLEELLKKYNTDSKKVLEDTSTINKIEESAEVNDATIEELRPDQNLDVDAAVIKKIKNSVKEKPKVISSDFSNSVRLALEPLQQMSEPELLKRLDEATKKSPVRPYMDLYPGVTLFTVRLIKDKESVPALAKILEDRDRLIKFGGVLIFTIIFGFILKKAMKKEGRSFLESVFFFFLRMVIMSAIRLSIVYFFFSVELGPAIKVFKQTFYS